MTKSADEKRWIVYTDGACSGNPGQGGWAYVMFDGNDLVHEEAGYEDQTTNNRMELSAVIFAFRKIHELAKQNQMSSPIWVHSDSSYVIQGITTWIFGWKKRGWKNMEGKEVANQDLWIQLDEVVQPYRSKIQWIHVPGHAGIPGNERCDELSVKIISEQGHFADQMSRLEYGIDIFTPVDLAKYKKIDPYYLSYVNGVLTQHKTWPACEAAVKGRPGAKFKKVKSQHEETQVMKDWGLAE